MSVLYVVEGFFFKILKICWGFFFFLAFSGFIE